MHLSVSYFFIYIYIYLQVKTQISYNSDNSRNKKKKEKKTEANPGARSQFLLGGEEHLIKCHFSIFLYRRFSSLYLGTTSTTLAKRTQLFSIFPECCIVTQHSIFLFTVIIPTYPFSLGAAKKKIVEKSIFTKFLAETQINEKIDELVLFMYFFL